MTVSTELAVATRGVGQAPVAGSEEGVGTRVNERDTAQGAGACRTGCSAQQSRPESSSRLLYSPTA